MLLNWLNNFVSKNSAKIVAIEGIPKGYGGGVGGVEVLLFPAHQPQI